MTQEVPHRTEEAIAQGLGRFSDPARRNDQELARLAKINTLREQGIDPYPPRVQRSHPIVALLAMEPEAEGEAPELAIAGRLVRLRNLGRLSFAALDDGTATIQIMVRSHHVGKAWYRDFWNRLVDLGDFLAVQGTLTRTRTGELTVDVNALQIASKSLQPLPDKWHGVQDPEVRYRRRYVDLVANPEVRDVFRTRARVLRQIRGYLDAAGFLEVETPILQPLYGGAAAKPFVTHHNQLHQDLYLRISFELYLKRLIVGGYDKVYEIGRDFRNEGVSFKHNPEFTQIEFYEAYTDYAQVMDRLEEMLAGVVETVCGSTTVRYQDADISFATPWKRMTLRDAIGTATEVDIEEHRTADELRDAMRRVGIAAEPKALWGKLVDSLLSRYVEPKVRDPLFLMEYPREISPFAKGVPGRDHLVERFELFVAGMELANAFTEINDPRDQYERFLGEVFRESQGDDEAHQMDDDFVESLEWGMPPTGGCGMGIDRLVMLLTDKSTIREVIPFPHLREYR